MAKYKSDINFFECIFKDKTKKAINLEKEIKKSVMIFGVIAVAVGGVLGVVCLGQKTMLEVTKANSAKLRETYDFDAIAAKKAECERLTADNKKIQEELVKFNAAPQFKTDLFGYIAAAQPEGVAIGSIDYDSKNSEITMNCTGTEELTGAQFANRLREQSEIFSDVEYTGASGKDGKWTFEVIVVVRNKAEEEVAAAKEAAEKAMETENASEETTKEAN